MHWQHHLAMRWRGFVTQAVYHWNVPRLLRFAFLFSAGAAVCTGLWFTVQGWLTISAEEQYLLQLDDLMVILLSYSVLFLLLNLLAIGLYMLLMGWIAFWLGRLGHISPLRYAQACRLVLATGIPLLVVVLVFGQALQLSFQLGMLLMLVHAAWLRNIELPAEHE